MLLEFAKWHVQVDVIVKMSRQEWNRRNSMSFSTPQPQRRPSRARHSLSIIEMDGEKDPNDVLFETLMGDPLKRAALLKLLSQEKDKIENIKRQEADKFGKVINASPLKKIKRKFICESPTALLKRRALERNEGASPSKMVHSSIIPSAVPFERLLQGVVAYVELKGKEGDRSAGAKILMQSMGATVRDQFTNDVTHVIFKDGSFNTYQKAKLMKKHLVSVLWLEAVRKNHSHVPERSYPALGTDLFDVNVSTFCQELQRDYEDIVRDELRLSFTAYRGKSMHESQLNSIHESPNLMTRSSSDKSRSSEDLIAASQDCDVRSVISRAGRTLPSKGKAQSILSTPDSRRLQNSTPDLTSDSDSELGVINGYSSTKIKDSLELVQMNTLIKKNSDAHVVESNSKSSRLHASTSTNESGVNISSESTSLLMHNVTSKVENGQQKTPRRRTLFNYVSIEETLGMTEKTSKRKSLHSTIKTNNKNVTRRSTADMDFTNVGNDIFVTKRKRKTPSKNSLHDSANFADDAILSMNQNAADNDCISTSTFSIIQIPSDNSKDVSNKSSTPKELSSLRLSKDKTHDCIRNELSTDGVPLRIFTTSVDDKSDAGKIFSTEDMCSLRLSLNNSYNSMLRNTSKSHNSNCIESAHSSCEVTVNDVIINAVHTLEKDTLPLSKNETPPKKFQDGEVVKSNLEKYDEQGKKLNKSRTQVTNSADINASDSDDTAVTKQRKARKLYNINEEISVSLYENDQPVKKKQLCEQVFKKPAEIRLTSFMLTPNARNYIENIKKGASGSSGEEVETDTVINKRNIMTETNKNNLTNKKNLTDKVNKTNKKNNGIVKVRKANCHINSKEATASLSREDDQKNADAKRNMTNKRNKSNKKTKTNFKDLIKKLHETEVNSGSSSSKRNKQKENKPNDINKAGNNRVMSTPTRKSCRLTRILNAPNESSASDLPNISNDLIGITPYKLRRSTLDFLPKQPIKIASAKGTQHKRVKISSIVCTRFHNPEVQVFHQIVRKLGGFYVEDEVTNKTSHLVVGEAKRTINILRAIARGCWIVRAEWLYKSLEEGKWLPEEDYELTEFSAAVQQSRLQRQAFGSSYSMDTFCNSGPIYVAKSSTPRWSDLQELITLCKGKVTNVQRNASIVVGESYGHAGVICVSENWLLDCIMINRKKSFKNYLIQVNETQRHSPNF